ncbi:hypothetical protein Nepgr_011837 [Nepenthes gracilis]|uniref:Uncharacterized protein n=1 Tax=Nepenthes gracilis TaxID=150966 RepID=A0AAD3SFU4_NEPGR|nr:hypothetical protein Nepgr_011837 [Nepenthes gracilis]
MADDGEDNSGSAERKKRRERRKLTGRVGNKDGKHWGTGKVRRRTNLPLGFAEVSRLPLHRNEDEDAHSLMHGRPQL